MKFHVVYFKLILREFYLLCGKGIWWKHNRRTNDIEFFDSSNESEFQAEGPEMFDFTEKSISENTQTLRNLWDKCVDENIELPIAKVKLYNKDGEYVEQKDCLDTDYEVCMYRFYSENCKNTRLKTCKKKYISIIFPKLCNFL